ncbi:MAG: protein-disulfide reductase DsbD family protein, partial [Rhodospirillales bacterium]
LFAFNLAGLFDVRLSSGLAEAGYRAGDAQGVTGAFLQGVFATLLATPCSAPFVGTALGFAFSRGAGDILAIFTALGLGLALPYLVIALWPRLATALPRPGPWMVWVKHFLALALAGTTLWLLSLLAGAQSTNTALLVAALLAVSGLLLAFGRRFGGRTVWAGVALMVGAALIVPGHVPADARDGDLFASKASSDFVWAPFDPDRIDDLVAAGKVVYVDVTADWCVTCIVNKKVILADEEARAALQAADVITMQADWTKPDADIAAYLASFGRYAIPFNAVYGPARPAGRALPELLTPGLVIEALKSSRS